MGEKKKGRKNLLQLISVCGIQTLTSLFYAAIGVVILWLFVSFPVWQTPLVIVMNYINSSWNFCVRWDFVNIKHLFSGFSLNWEMKLWGGGGWTAESSYKVLMAWNTPRSWIQMLPMCSGMSARGSKRLQ